MNAPPRPALFSLAPDEDSRERRFRARRRLDRIYLKRARNKFSGCFPANVLFDGVNSSLPRAHQAAEVVIKLQIVRQHRPEYLEIAAVISVEESGVERLYGLKERIGSRRTL